jgi:hypothetical protein
MFKDSNNSGKIRTMAEIIVNPNIVFDGRAILCQLFCESCAATFCGAWRNDWVSKLCRECQNGQVTPVVAYEICKTVFEPSGVKLN